MVFDRKLTRIVSAMVMALVLATVPVLADTIKLKDGSVIKGRIVSFTEGKFTIVIGTGSRQRQMNFFTDEIDSIEFDGTNGMVGRATIPSYNDAGVTSARLGAGNVQGQSGPSASVLNTIPEPIKTVSPSGKTIPINMKVSAGNENNGWTSTGFVAKKGQRIRITATGKVSLGKLGSSTPGGMAAVADRDKLMSGEPTGALIAVIGDDNNDFVLIGTSKEFIATRDGMLFLGLNEGFLDDNAGSFDVTVEIDPGK